jgi:hypothetical protein
VDLRPAAHDRRHHHLDIVAGRGGGQCLRTAFHARRGAAVAQRGTRLRRGLRVHQHHQIRVEALRLLDDGLPAASRAEHRDPVPLRMQGNDLERAAADASGGT